MKIAFISYEYPPDTAYGGIATYIYQVAKMLSNRGHHVEVFTCSSHRNGTEIEDEIVVHRVIETNRRNRREFSQRIGRLFAQRHHEVHFDVLEAPEADAHARGAVELVPDIPLVVKLHTPRFLCQQLGYVEPSIDLKIRRFVGAVRRGNKPTPLPRFQYNASDIENDLEHIHTLDADEITTPSKDLGEKLIQVWGLDAEKVVHLPNPYIPSPELLNISLDINTNRISFVGRLEVRKGILDLSNAIPLVIAQYPQAKFRFIGTASVSPRPKLNMQQYLEKKLWRCSSALEFTGKVSLEKIPDLLANTDICVFPSVWENFPNVCLEAMSAGRAIVGSSAGGMKDMLDNGQAGKLVPPRSPEKIAEAIIELLNNQTLRIKLGTAARKRVLSDYNLEKIGLLQETSYLRAIERRKVLGARKRTINNLVAEFQLS